MTSYCDEPLDVMLAKYHSEQCGNREHDEFLTLPCEHVFCKVCFFDWIKTQTVKCTQCEFTSTQLEELSKKKNSHACYILGLMYHEGIKLDQKWHLAERYYLSAIESKDCSLEVYRELGNLYHDSLSDPDKAFNTYSELFKQLTEKRRNLKPFVESLTNLAKLHWYGHHNGQKNEKEAIRILTSALTPYQTKETWSALGTMYLNDGDTVASDLFESYRYYSLANCKCSMAYLQWLIGNNKKSLEILETVSPDDHVSYRYAMIQMGSIYTINSHGIEKDLKKAFHCFERSTLSGECYIGYLHIGDLYAEGQFDIDREEGYKKAESFYKLFLEKNKDSTEFHCAYERLIALCEKTKDKKNQELYQKLHAVSLKFVKAEEDFQTTRPMIAMRLSKMQDSRRFCLGEQETKTKKQNSDEKKTVEKKENTVEQIKHLLKDRFNLQKITTSDNQVDKFVLARDAFASLTDIESGVIEPLRREYIRFMTKLCENNADTRTESDDNN